MPDSLVHFKTKKQYAAQFTANLEKVYNIVTAEYLHDCEYYKDHLYPSRLPFNNWSRSEQAGKEDVVFEMQSLLSDVDSDYIRIFCIELANLDKACPFDCDVDYYQRNADGEFHMRVQFFPEDALIGWRFFRTMNFGEGDCAIVCPSCGKVFPQDAPDDWFDIYYCPYCEEGLDIRGDNAVEAEGGFVEYNEDTGWSDY